MGCVAATLHHVPWHLSCVTLIGLAFAFTVCAAHPAAPARGVAGSAAAGAKAPASHEGASGGTRSETRSVSTLLDLALAAYKDGRLVAPASDNATHYYMAVLRKDPHNRIALEALRESFPYAVAQIERTIGQHDYAEATREIALLAQTDPTNYTLKILRKKLADKSGVHADAPGTGAHVLTLHASASSWIEVRDAAGNILDSRVLQPGESRSYHVDGAVTVTLGNAGGVEVTSDGKDFPLKPGYRDKVMHLEFFAQH
jgi:protein TonB